MEGKFISFINCETVLDVFGRHGCGVVGVVVAILRWFVVAAQVSNHYVVLKLRARDVTPAPKSTTNMRTPKIPTPKGRLPEPYAATEHRIEQDIDWLEQQEKSNVSTATT